jgi:hypothetical protein
LNCFPHERSVICIHFLVFLVAVDDIFLDQIAEFRTVLKEEMRVVLNQDMLMTFRKGEVLLFDIGLVGERGKVILSLDVLEPGSVSRRVDAIKLADGT